MAGSKKSKAASNTAIAKPRDDFDWDDFRVFAAIAKIGTIKGAAEALHLSQPTISQRLRALEAQLDAQLMVRTPSGLMLTEIGKELLAPLETASRSIEAAQRIVKQHDRRDEGRVRIAVPDGVAAYWLAPRIWDFQRLNPKIALTLDAGLWPNDAVGREVEMSIQFEESKIGDNVVMRLCTMHYAAFVARPYVDLYGMPKSIQDIPNHRTIHHAAQTRQPETYDRKVEAVRELWEANLETNSSAIVVEALRAGAGVAFAPTAITTVDPELIMIGETPMASLQCWLVYHADVGRIRRVRRVIEWLQDVFSPAKNPWYRPEFIHPREFSKLTAAAC